MPSFHIHAQTNRAVNRLVRAGLGAFVFLVVLICLSACGKRPGKIDPPPGVEDAYSHAVYPNPSTDPPLPVSVDKGMP